MHQRDDFAEGRFAAGSGDFDAQQAIEINRATEHRHADAGLHRHRFAGNGRGVQTRLTGQHPTVRRHPVTGANFHPIASLERTVVHLDDGAIRLDLACMAASQFAEGVNGFLRANDAALFQHVAEDHDDRQQRRRQQIACRPGPQHGQGDQLIGNPVQTRIPQAVPGRPHDRHGHQYGSKTQEQLADTDLIRRPPAPQEAQREQAECKHGQRQLTGSAALFCRGQHARRSSLSGHCAAP